MEKKKNNVKCAKTDWRAIRKAIVLAAALGCGMLTGCGTLNFNTAKVPGEDYHVSVQTLPVYDAPAADAKIVASLNLGDNFIAEEIIPPTGHLLTDQADPWVRASRNGVKFYAPGGAIISKPLWEAQLKGLPPRGEVRVKNFTSAKHQESEAELEQAKSYRPGSLRLMLGAAGNTKAASEIAQPEALTDYILAQSGKRAAVELPKPQSSSLGLPSLQVFTEIGPFQEFDLGAGLAAFMMPKALKPDHPITIYVANVVGKLLKKSNMPQTFSGYHVLVLNDDETINACAAPGGFVIVTTGMLKFLENENELAMILAHEIGHLEFHHSVREMGAENYASFSLAALDAATDLNDPAVKQAIIDQATEVTRAIPFFDRLDPAVQQQKIDDAVAEALKEAQELKSNALAKMSELAMMVGNTLTTGYNVDFEAAADRRAISLGEAAGYDTAALSDVLERLKKRNNGFGEAYPADRDVLVRNFRQNYPATPQVKFVGSYTDMRKEADSLNPADLFLNK